MMLLFMVACLAMMFFMMRRHLQPNGHGSAAFSDSRLGPWRNAGSTDTENRQTTAAFEEYREETLRRLEGEQTAFKSFLDQLRLAKDRAEFEQFMTQRKFG
jgi:hypothetical protein